MRSCQVPTKDQFYYNVITAWTWSHLIQGISQNLKSFIVWKINHLKRDCNKVARVLAQFAKCSGTNQVWKGVSPPMVQHLIQLDKTLMFYCISLKLFMCFCSVIALYLDFVVFHFQLNEYKLFQSKKKSPIARMPFCDMEFNLECNIDNANYS